MSESPSPVVPGARRMWPHSPAARDLLAGAGAVLALMALPSLLALPALALIAGSSLFGIAGRNRLLAWPLPLTLILALVAMTTNELSRLRVVSPEGAQRRIADDYRKELDSLAAQAAAVAARVEIPVTNDESRLLAFRQLEAALGEARSGPGTTVLLVDPDGAAIAWVGEGFRHQLPTTGLPDAGLDFVRSFTAVTVYAVQPLEALPRSWRVVVGRSYSTMELPFGAFRATGEPLPQWTLRRADDDSSQVDPWTEISASGLPILRLREGQRVAPRFEPVPGGVGWWILALGILVTGLAHTLVAVSVAVGDEAAALGVGLMVRFCMVGGIALGHSEGAGIPALLVFGLATAWLAFSLRARRVLSRWSEPVAAAAAVVAVALAAHLAALGTPLDLGEELWVSADGWLVRIGLWGLVAGAVLFRGGVARGERWLWLALALCAAGAMLLDRPVLSLAALVAASAFLGHWRAGRGRVGDYVAMAVAAAVLSAATWSLGSSRIHFAVPSPESDVDVVGRAQQFFESIDLRELALGDPDLLAERQDLALALWRPSPLGAFGGASAILVLPGEGEDSAFSFGLPIDSVFGQINPDERSWRGEDLLNADRAGLLSTGRFWGVVRYWWVEGETSRRRGRPPLETGELARELLRGSSARSSEGGAAITASGDGRLEALRRVGINAVATIGALLAGGLLALPLALAMPTLRAALERFFNSYSRKLILVFIVLLMLPMVLFSLFLFRTVGEHLIAEQRTDGEAAVGSAVRILEDYLPSLEPGFSITAELDNEMMIWLSQVVSHEVNLYWRGYEWASSRPELFVAGLLPKRIPGDVFSRLALAGERVASRASSAAGGPSYLELYAPVTLPGESPASGLFLSVPLLAEQEEATRELRRLTHQAVIVVCFLLLVLFRVGARLAESFTTPLMQLVEGTDRIAKGAASLELEPKEPELSALAEAIDDMARRIDEGRQRLIREKQVIESVVANINSAVVSIGRDSRVQMCNALAREYLGAEIGQPIAELAESRLGEPLKELVLDPPRRLSQQTVRLLDEDGEEQEWTVVWVPVAGSGDPAALLVIEDVTEVLRGQRLEAWAEMARMIGHEIKNPLTPIRLSAEHLRRVKNQAPERIDEVFDRCIDNILEQVAELREIAAEFSAFSRIPRAELEAGDLSASVGQVVDAYRASPPAGLTVSFEGSDEPVRMSFDERLISRAVRNLLENAIHASGDGGTVSVRVSSDAGRARVVVADRGSGVPPEHLARIFEPNFSTSSGGTGLGLAITQRIIREHRGSVVAENRDGGGLVVTIDLPIAEHGAPE